MKDERPFQLRNYHIRRGRPKDSSPLYPITKAEYIIGDIGGVTKVTVLPETGEEGKIYYNTTDKKYYVYDSTSTSYKELRVGQGIPVASTIRHKPTNGDSLDSNIDTNNRFILEQDTYYYLNDFIVEAEGSITLVNLWFEGMGNDDSDYTRQYIWRMTIPTNNVNLSMTGVLNTPQSTKDILDNLEVGHDYEFNLLEGVLFVADITDVVNS